VKITRRKVLGMGAALVALNSVPLLARPRLDAARPMVPRRDNVASGEGKIVDVTLHAKVRSTQLFGDATLPLWTYHDDILPVIRVPQGARLRTHFKNDLPEHTSIHWHGIRLPNHMDGVPYVTQQPVEPGEKFDYDFTLPDTGLFPFHSHCNTAEQLGRGLAGALIVTGDETRPYDADLLCVIKDWRLGPNGEFINFTDDNGSARGGTFGSHRSVNFETIPVLEAPAGGDIRLRLMNVDNSRVNQVGLDGADEAAIIATDGQAIAPTSFKTWRLGSAMRLDLCVRMPKAGEVVSIYDYFAPEPVLLASIKATGPGLKRGDFDPAPLYAPEIPEPDIANAIHKRIEFSATPTPQPNLITLSNGEQLNLADELCLSDKTFWAINKTTWPEGGHKRMPAPVLTLQKNRTYVFELVNITPHMHPIHIHGHTFLYLKSNKRSLPKHFTDTVLLKPKERIHVAFKADNPGDWMFHCHIIEHAETGMMSILRVA
jgi:FtsP/CotA-like multicopper oxidase with cupredoxin domain